MPKATVSQTPTRFDLKMCPGGFVMLKTLPYGQTLERRDNAMRMSMEQSPGRKRDETQRLDLEMMQAVTRQYEFANCIVDHNLEDENGTKLDFSTPFGLKMLDPKIGEEIERYIDELHSDEDLEDFIKRSLSSSPTKEQEKASALTEKSKTTQDAG
jgi:hypothetical protein